MSEQKIKWAYKVPLTEKQLHELADRILLEDLPLDNSVITDEEDDDEEHIDDYFDNTISEPRLFRPDINEPVPSTSAYNPETQQQTQISITTATPDDIREELEEEPKESNMELPNSKKSKRLGKKSKQKKVQADKPVITEEAKRKWKKEDKDEYMPDYSLPVGPIEEEFCNCHSPTDVYLHLLGEVIDDVVFQSNLYATQQNKNLNLKREELLAFIGINFMMAYHRLPSWKLYWNGSPDLGVPLVANCMPRNRFEEILRYIHCNDNNLIPNGNKDKLYKIRPMVTTLNSRFRMCYRTTRRTSIDESMILFKGRSSLKQYNPMKPIKRGYKLWCQADQNAYISDFEIYQGKNENIEEELKEYGLGERVVLSLTKPDWGKNKIIYADNYFMSISLLEKLRMKNTLGCGTIQSKRKGFPTNMKDDKTMVRGDYDHRVSNTDIRVFKWKDNRVVHFASNFHSTQETTVKRTQKDGSRIDVKCPLIVSDYNKHMGGVDRADQRRANYGMNRRSRKWWHRLFWGMLDIAFVNAHVIYNKLFDEMTTLEFRRSISLGFMTANNTRKRVSNVSTTTKRRKYNYSIPDDIRLGNKGSHWVMYEKSRGRCEMCSSRCVQSRPHSKCSACNVFLCSNEKKNCFLEYHEV